MSIKQQRSIELFNRALDAKRSGNISEAVRLQKASIREYPEDPEIYQNYYALGKLFYLLKDTNKAMAAYRVYVGFVVLTNPMVIDDYKAVGRQLPVGSFIPQEIPGSNALPGASQRLGFFFNVSRHIGHVLFDDEYETRFFDEIKYYRDGLLNKPRVAPKEFRYDAAMEDGGSKFVKKWLDEFCDDWDKSVRETVGLANFIVEEG